MKVNNFFLLLFILIAAFIVRLFPIDFPRLTSEEARIAFRGYTLATTGNDELGRPHPLLFNSLEDYQLPAVSYITALGVSFFGKSDFGVRIPFILIGTILVLLVYQIAKSLNPKPSFWLISSLIVAISPPLIFLSKAPNETIVLTFVFTLLFYLLTKDIHSQISNKNLFCIMIMMVASMFVSKFSWFILVPFVAFTLYAFQKRSDKKVKILLVASIVIVVIATGFFLTVPQSRRSLTENNFPIFSDATIKNGIDKLRGQGTDSNWPPLVDRILFNKTHFFTTGFIHWLSYLSPAIYFGKFDSTGKSSFAFMGALSKILIIPTIFAFFSIIRRGKQRKILYLLYFFVLTFPSIFIYPGLNLELIILTIPLMAIFITFGFLQFRRGISIVILILMIFETAINVCNFSLENKNADSIRPIWIKAISVDISKLKDKYQITISDDITNDVLSFIEWYAPIKPKKDFSDITWPYKFHQYSLGNIQLIGASNDFRPCISGEKPIFLVSTRDLKRIQHGFKVQIIKSYSDITGENQAFLLSNGAVCLN